MKLLEVKPYHLAHYMWPEFILFGYCSFINMWPNVCKLVRIIIMLASQLYPNNWWLCIHVHSCKMSLVCSFQQYKVGLIRKQMLCNKVVKCSYGRIQCICSIQKWSSTKVQRIKSKQQFCICDWQVIRIPETSDETFNSLLEFGAAVGKTTVNCKVCYYSGTLFWIYAKSQ